jgi:hypothetical protein
MIDAADDDVHEQGDVPPLESLNEEDKPADEAMETAA